MPNLTPTPGWDAVPEIEVTTKVLGGPGGPANTQAQALLDRTELIAQGTATTAAALTGAEVASISQNGSIVGATLTAILTWFKNTLMTRTNNLSDLTNLSTARTNLGLGAVATLNTVPVANGGTGQTSASGTTLDAISGFSGTGYVQRTGAGAYNFVTTPYTLPPTTTSTLGGMITGNGLSVAAGNVSVNAGAGLTTSAGAVVVNAGAGITIASGQVTVTGVGAKSLTGASSSAMSYRTNADGTIEVWGLTVIGVGVTSVEVTLPVTFPNGFVGWATSDTGVSCFSFGITVVDNSHINVLAPQYWFTGTGTVAARASATCAWHVVGY